MKGTKILGVLWIVVSVLLAWILISHLTKGGNFMFGLFGAKEEKSVSVPENADTHFAAVDIKSIDADVSFGKIIVEKKAVGDICVSIEGNKNLWPSVYVRDGVLKIEGPERMLYIGFKTLTVTVVLPQDYEPEEIDLKSTSGSMEITGIKTRNLDMKASSGSVRLENCEAETADIKTTSGSLKAEGCRFGFLDCKVSSGSIRLGGAIGKMDVNVMSGSVHVNLSEALTGDSKVHSVSGSLNLSVPHDSNLGIKYSTMSGSYKNQITGASGKKGTDMIGNGSVKLDLSATSGSIKIE